MLRDTLVESGCYVYSGVRRRLGSVSVVIRQARRQQLHGSRVSVCDFDLRALRFLTLPQVYSYFLNFCDAACIPTFLQRSSLAGTRKISGWHYRCPAPSPTRSLLTERFLALYQVPPSSCFAVRILRYPPIHFRYFDLLQDVIRNFQQMTTTITEIRI